jgi:cytochrome c oxidase assembly protein subunit 15
MTVSADTSAPVHNRALHRFAIATAVAGFVLVGAGGLVTSHGVGMAVPDWPNTYGYNMFFFPVSRWVSGIFYEHTHRLIASGVGLMTTILAIWCYGTAARSLLRWTGMAFLLLGPAVAASAPNHGADALVLAVTGLAAFGASLVWPQCSPGPLWLRRLALVAFFAVVLQGVLGGLRVRLMKDQIGIFHATLAQLFFALLCALAFLTRDAGRDAVLGVPNQKKIRDTEDGVPARYILLFTTFLILVQLVLGATMRHQHAGLSIPDFPLAYGKIWPATDPASVAVYNQHRLEVTDANPITATQIVLQMVHRAVALVILAAVAICAWSLRRSLGSKSLSSRLALVWLGLILTQALLGAATIWSNKAADIATAHVMVGALALALGVIQCIILYPLASLAESQREAAADLKIEQCKWQTAS